MTTPEGFARVQNSQRTGVDGCCCLVDNERPAHRSLSKAWWRSIPGSALLFSHSFFSTAPFSALPQGDLVLRSFHSQFALLNEDAGNEYRHLFR